MANDSSADLLAGLDAIVKLALEEDVGSGDLTGALVPASRQATAMVVTRERCILCGVPWFERVFTLLGAGVRFDWHRREGAQFEIDDPVCTLRGPARALLAGERTALNFLQTLSGTATETRRYVEALAGTGTQLLDTRKTLPGLRRAQKYAVRIGGGRNHRIGLFDGILIKENHIAAAGGVAAAVGACRKLHPNRSVECEVETLAEAEAAVAAGAHMLLLDDFSLEDMATTRRRAPHPIKLEASGSMSFERLREVAATGVDYISVGAITKHVRAIDLSMRIT